MAALFSTLEVEKWWLWLAGRLALMTIIMLRRQMTMAGTMIMTMTMKDAAVLHANRRLAWLSLS